MTTIEEFEARINETETAIGELRAHIDVLRVGLHYLKNREPEPEPESLFGRWATHPDLGRGIIVSVYADRESEVEFAYIEEDSSTGAVVEYVPTNDLTIDPATLTTLEDYKGAPVGTIIERGNGFVARKIGKQLWDATGSTALWSNTELADIAGTSRVVRWGTGE